LSVLIGFDPESWKKIQNAFPSGMLPSQPASKLFPLIAVYAGLAEYSGQEFLPYVTLVGIGQP
jgi:hypothetical protein